jgi:hypothetical protein
MQALRLTVGRVAKKFHKTKWLRWIVIKFLPVDQEFQDNLMTYFI